MGSIKHTNYTPVVKLRIPLHVVGHQYAPGDCKVVRVMIPTTTTFVATTQKQKLLANQ